MRMATILFQFQVSQKFVIFSDNSYSCKMIEIQHCIQRLVGIIFIFLFSNVHGQKENRYEFYHQQMGTSFRIVLYSSDSLMAHKSASASFSRLDDLNAVFSDYDLESEVNGLHAKYEPLVWTEISEDLYRVVKYAFEVSEKSNGAFDVSIGPLSKLWRKAIRHQKLPSAEEIIRAKEKVNYHSINISNVSTHIQYDNPNIRMDFGGIAKGYALDQMAEVLYRNGIVAFLIDGGGDILTGASPPQKGGWEIELPSGELIVISNKAIATSGDTYKYLVNRGKKYSHLIDPRTGYGIENSPVVTVLADTAMKADSWASAISVMKDKERKRVILKENMDEYVYIFKPN